MQFHATCEPERSRRIRPNRLRRSAVRLAGSTLLIALVGALHVRAQTRPPDPSDPGSARVSSLNLKPGCWQIRVQTSTEVDPASLKQDVKLPTADELLQQAMSKLTPEQRAQFPVEQWRKFYADLLAQERAAIEKQPQFLANALKKGGTQTGPSCIATPFAQQGRDILGTPVEGCTRTVHASGTALHAQVTCGPRTTDYAISDAENFSSTDHIKNGSAPNPANAGQSSASPGDVPSTQITTTTGKWIGELESHMPHHPEPTDLDGKKFIGIAAIGTYDPHRIVAQIDGKQLTAFQVWGYFKGVIPAWGEEGKVTPPVEELQLLYMHSVIADEAQKMGLDKQQPWKGQLIGQGAWGIETDPYDVKVNSVDGEVHAEYQRERILYAAYLNQAPPGAARDQFEQKIKARFKVTVIDPDFFLTPGKS